MRICARIWASLILFGVCVHSATAAKRLSDNELAAIKPDQAYTLSLICGSENEQHLSSRVAVFDVSDSQTMDVGITTAHGLISSSGDVYEICHVSAFDGRFIPVTSVHIAHNYLAGTATDWAIITFERVKSAEIVRYALAAPLSVETFDRLAEQQLTVQFASAKGLPDNKQTCTIFPKRYAGFRHEKHNGILPHSCHAVAGQSGAPISVTRNDQPVLIGFHLGRAFSLGSTQYGRPGRYGYMRIFDETLRDYVNRMISDMSQ